MMTLYSAIMGKLSPPLAGMRMGGWGVETSTPAVSAFSAPRITTPAMSGLNQLGSLSFTVASPVMSRGESELASRTLMEKIKHIYLLLYLSLFNFIMVSTLTSPQGKICLLCDQR